MALWWIRADKGVGWVRELVDGEPLVTADRAEAAQLERAVAWRALASLGTEDVRWRLVRVPPGSRAPVRHGEPTA